MQRTFSGDAPGITLEALLSSLPLERTRKFVPRHVWALVQAVDPNLLSSDRAAELIARAIDPSELLSHAASRGEVLQLLSIEKARELVQRLGLDSAANPYRTLSACRFEGREQAILLGFFGVAAVERAPIARQAELEHVKAAYGLFPHQRDLVRRVEDALRNRTSRLLMHMPTGSGKTRTAMNIVARYLANSEPRTAVWFAQSSELLEQAAQEFIRAWHYLGNRDVAIHRFWGAHNPSLSSLNDGVVICGFAKLHAAGQRDPNVVLRLGDHAGLIVVDEAHQAIAPTYRQMIDSLQLKRPANRLIGLSATPGRTWNNIEADAELANFFGGEKLTIEVPGYSDPVQFLVDHGYLARTHFRRLISAATDFRAELDSAGDDISQASLLELGENQDRNVQIVRVVEELFERHSRIILFAASVPHAKLISMILSLRGLDSSVVTAETDPVTREALIRRFKLEDGSKRIICNYGVLTTGFDAPKTSAAVIARPTRSLVLFSQMVGRAIRGPRAGGNANCEIVTIVDPSLPGFGSVADAFNNWEDVWA